MIGPTPRAAWDRIGAANLMAHVEAARLLLPGMLEPRSGYFLNTASAAGLLSPFEAPYAVTKHAAVAFAEGLSITYGDLGESADRQSARWARASWRRRRPPGSRSKRSRTTGSSSCRMILVPKDTPGVRIVRDLTVFGYDDAPVGHPEIAYENVRVPLENIILGEGRGFEVAQGRLGPGRIHHCMRLVGCAQRALELMCRRANSRFAFGRYLGEHGSVREDIARSFCEIEQARTLTLRAADKMDRAGNKEARDLIAAAKIAVPEMACKVIDRAIQIHGGAGVTQDTFLPEAYAYARFMRMGDGPDQVHLSALGKALLKRFPADPPPA